MEAGYQRMKLKVVILVLLAAVLLTVSAYAQSEETVIARINNALTRQQIDYETALTYKVLAVVAPDDLPGAYRMAEKEVIKCGAQVMLELTKNWENLSRATRDVLSPHLMMSPRFLPKDPNLRRKSVYQPSLPNSYQTTNFNMEWGDTVPAITEWQDNNGNGRPDYIDNLAVYLETTWSEEIDTLQLKAPGQSATYLFNVYIGDTGGSSPGVGSSTYGYTATFPYDPGLNGPTNMAYIAMNKDYTDFGDNDDPAGKFLGAMKVTLAHEFFHAVQFAYDSSESAWMMELCSTWMEDKIFDEVNDYVNYLVGEGSGSAPGGWQMYPETSLVYFNGYHEYGNVIFGKYLSEKYPGVNIMKELWEILDNVSGDNSIAALGSFLLAQTPSSSLNDAFNEFTAKNAVMDYDEGANYGGYGSTEKMYYQDTVITSYPVTNKSYSGYRPDYLGSNYTVFTNSAAAKSLKIDFNGQTSFNSHAITWSVAAVAVKAAGGYDILEFSLDSSADGSQTIPGFGAGGTYNKVYLICRVLSETGVTPPPPEPPDYTTTPYSSYPDGVPYTFSASLETITVTTSSTTIPLGISQQFSASGGTAPYTWESSNTGVATIDSGGLLTTVATGTCVVTATDANTLSGDSGTITITSTTVSPATGLASIGDTIQFSASGGTAPYTWESSNTGVATIDNGGLLTAVNYGTCVVTATDANGVYGVSGTVTITFTISPGVTSIAQGATQQFTASGGAAPYAWESSNTGVATIDSNGLLTAVAVGTFTVTATDANGVEGVSGTITVTKTTVSPNSTLVLNVGDTFQFTASDGTAPYSWQTSDTNVATISSGGFLTAIAGGNGCTVTATDANGVEGVSGTILVNAPGSSGGGDSSGGSSSSSSSSSNTRLCPAGVIAWKTPLENSLSTIRKFRDKVLKKSKTGRGFIHKYYEYGPIISKFIQDRPILKTPLRYILTVIVWLLTFVLEGAALIKSLFWLSISLLTLSLAWRKNRRFTKITR